MTDKKLNNNITESVEKAFYQWLITKSSESTEDYNDGMFDENMLSSGIALDKKSRKPNQRVLLDVEKQGEMRRADERKQKESFRVMANTILSQNMHKHMSSVLSDSNNVLPIAKLPATFSDLMDVLYSPSSNYRSLASIISGTVGLPKQILALVNNSDFCSTVGREVRLIKDPQTAIGAIGAVGLRQVIPMMIMKGSLKFECEHFPRLSQKLWSFGTTKGNAMAALLRHHGYGKEEGDELDGLLLGAFTILGMVCIHHQFSRSFEDVRQGCLVKLRDQQKRDLYNGMIEAEADRAMMQTFMYQYGPTVTAMLVENFNWGNRLAHLKRAFEDEHANIAIEQRSLHGKLILQADRYAKFEMLRKAKRFPGKEAIKPYFSGCGIDASALTELNSSDLRKLDMRRYIG